MSQTLQPTAQRLDRARPFGKTRGRPGVSYTQDSAYFDGEGNFVCLIKNAPAMVLTEDGEVVPANSPKAASASETSNGQADEMRALIAEMNKAKAEAEAAMQALVAAQQGIKPAAPPAPPVGEDEAYIDMHYTQLKALVEALGGEYTNKAEAIAFLEAHDRKMASPTDD